MKPNKIVKGVQILCIMTIMLSCITENDFEVPEPTEIVAIDLTGLQETTFTAVKSAYEQAIAQGLSIATFEDDLYITGYVVSSDQAGSFFEELIVQNVPDGSTIVTNPRLGFKVSINVSKLYQTYEFGRKVYIKLKGLSVGELNGVLVIGKGSRRIEQIQSFEYREYVIRSPEVLPIQPKVTTILDLSEADENTYIQLEDVQFTRYMLALTYAGEASDEFDGLRTLESCQDFSTVTIQTSTFANFKSLNLPRFKGQLKGVYSRDFRDAFNVIVLNTSADVKFDNETRCDPIELNCGLAPNSGSTVVFSDDFETQPGSGLIKGHGWTNFIEAGSEGFESYKDTGTNASQGVSARIGSYASGDIRNVAWLITPEINLDVLTGATLTFETSNSFADNSTMEVLYSNDWDGTPDGISKANWAVLSAAYIAQNSDAFAGWYTSGIIDLDCGSGKTHIAFKYAGSGDQGFDGTYELDNIAIKSN